MNTHRALTEATRAPVTEPPTISLAKTYRTREFLGCSNPVRLLMVDGGGDKPVVGAFYIEESAKWELGRWTAEGRWFGADDLQNEESSLDLVEVEAADPVQDAEPAKDEPKAKADPEAEQGAQIPRPGPAFCALAAALKPIREVARRFTNELGREVRISAQEFDYTFWIKIEGPDSVATNDLTKVEAKQLHAVLGAAIAAAEGCAA